MTTAPIDPLMLDVPLQLETERLLLCAPQAGWGTMINAVIRDSHDHLKKWFRWAKDIETPHQTEANIRHAIIKFHEREDLRYYLFRKEDGVILGAIGLRSIDWNVPSFSIGYWVSAKFQGKGYMTESVSGICHFAFDTCKAKRIEIHCDSRNFRSAAVAERAGFFYEGIRRRDSLDINGELCDTLVYVKFSE